MRIELVFVVVVFLCGCAPVKEHDVNMAVKTDCHPKKITPPPWAATSMTAETDIYTQAKMLTAERRQRIDYEKLLEAAAEACQ